MDHSSSFAIATISVAKVVINSFFVLPVKRWVSPLNVAVSCQGFFIIFFFIVTAALGLPRCGGRYAAFLMLRTMAFISE